MTKPDTKVTEKKNVSNSAKEKEPLPTQKEHGGFEDNNLPEPTRYGDWEVRGRCSDF
ncbi:MAG: hypothetical protein CMH27_01095 [Micavibrio sp.]|nr:hypothetical protein [Micavibrio sp.]|tara:strand:- start:1094 stop:1264 length:171 start_codon:yes stop_codon:yes gene_type:complete